LDALTRHRELKEAIRNGQATLGIFVRTPAVQIVETLGHSGTDFVVLDAEHAPFGASELDHCILAGRSVGLPVLVRLGDPSPAAILQVLDMGAAGIVVPHVVSAAMARDVVDACRYRGGSRGFSGQHRAASYGAIPGAEYRQASDASVIVIAQIEDADGLGRIDEIVAVSELDAVLVGRADLAVSLGCDSVNDSQVVDATNTILASSRKSGMTTSIFLPEANGIETFRHDGVSLFFIATDQSLLIAAARNVVDEFSASSEGPA
jgi:2-keto-3-deoxy-L-rhamnonate aldolase RhmA